MVQPFGSMCECAPTNVMSCQLSSKRRSARTQAQEYRWPVPLPGTLRSGVIPCVLKRYGLAVPCAFQFLTWLQQQRAVHLRRQGRDWAQAAALAAAELWQPLRACLLRADVQPLAGCREATPAHSQV
eukprot:3160661-Amphidinium_carterae.1